MHVSGAWYSTGGGRREVSLAFGSPLSLWFCCGLSAVAAVSLLSVFEVVSWFGGPLLLIIVVAIAQGNRKPGSPYSCLKLTLPSNFEHT